jgi:hypothetical protein
VLVKDVKGSALVPLGKAAEAAKKKMRKRKTKLAGSLEADEEINNDVVCAPEGGGRVKMWGCGRRESPIRPRPNLRVA